MVALFVISLRQLQLKDFLSKCKSHLMCLCKIPCLPGGWEAEADCCTVLFQGEVLYYTSN